MTGLKPIKQIERTRRLNVHMGMSIPPQWVSIAAGLVVLLLLALPGSTTYAGGPGQGLPYDETEAQSIDRNLMCPVCPAETIDQAQVEISRQMRAKVREMLAAGASRQEVLDFFVARYGVDVLAAPPKSGINLVAWALPVAGVLAALVGVLFILRSMVLRSGASAAGLPLADAELEPYLEAVDRELALPVSGAAGLANAPRTIPPPAPPSVSSPSVSSNEDGAAGASTQGGEGVVDPGEGETAQDG